jgi:hypothetical protein
MLGVRRTGQQGRRHADVGRLARFSCRRHEEGGAGPVGDEGARGEGADVYDALSDEAANKRKAMHKTDSVSKEIGAAE